MVQAVTTTAIMTPMQSMPRILAVIVVHWINVVFAGQLAKTTYTCLNEHNANYFSMAKIIYIQQMILNHP